jgi:hypothetical protein
MRVVFLYIFNLALLPGADDEHNQEPPDDGNVLQQHGAARAAGEIADAREFEEVGRGAAHVEGKHDCGKARADVEDDLESKSDLDDRQRNRY